MVIKIIKIFIRDGGEVHSGFSCPWGFTYSWCVTDDELLPKPLRWECWCLWGGQRKLWHVSVNTGSHPCTHDLRILRGPAWAWTLTLPLFCLVAAFAARWVRRLASDHRSCSIPSPRTPCVSRLVGFLQHKEAPWGQLPGGLILLIPR